MLPFFVNYLVRTYAWVALLSDEGLINNFLIDLGVTQTGIQMINTPWAVIGGLTYGYLVFMILPIYASLDRMDPSVIEAGKDLYGSKLQTFLHVTLPADQAGDPGRLACWSSCRRSATSSRPSCWAAPTPTWSGT